MLILDVCKWYGNPNKNQTANVAVKVTLLKVSKCRRVTCQSTLLI